MPASKYYSPRLDRELITTLFPLHAAAVSEEMAVLTPEEQRQLGELCRKLGKGLEQRQ